jgi:hypothetical protein
MATVATSLPRARSVRVTPAFAVVLLSLIAAGLYAWMRLPVARDMHAHIFHWCTRFDMQPQDWHCRISGALVDGAYLGGSLLIGLAVALPGVVLVASGRRLSALLPLAIAALATAVTPLLSIGGGSYGSFLGISRSLFDTGGGLTYWSTHGVLAVVADMLLISVPLLAIAFLLRPAKPASGALSAALPRHASWFATFAVAAAVVGVRFAWYQLPEDLAVHSTADTWIAVVTMAVFAALLGIDRRFWPWAIAPVAVLLSLGPATAVMSIPTRLTAFTWFSDVIPLVGVGLVASFWRPVALWANLRGPESLRVPEPVQEATTKAAPRRFRPAVALNAIAVMLVALSVVAQRADPLPIQLAVSLPTYLGERLFAQDVRAKLNLDEALGAMQAYHAEHGTYAGFDAATGESAAPALAWSDDATGRDLVVRVTAATKDRAQVVAASASGAAFCLQATGRTLTYGSVDHGDPTQAQVLCASTPWTSAATRMFNVDTLCDAEDDQTILICRAVQMNIRDTLATREPFDPAAV